VHTARAPATVDREQGGLERRGREDRDHGKQEAADPDRADERERHEDQQSQPDRDRRAREDHRPPGRLHRPDGCRLDLSPARQLLPEPVHDQQRVVDRDPDPDQEHEIGDVRRRGHEVGDHVDERQRPEHRAGREQERDRHRPAEAEDEQEDGDRDRQGDRFASPEVVAEDRVEVVLDRRRPRDECLRAGGTTDRRDQVVCVCLRVGEVEGRDDVPVENVASRHLERRPPTRRDRVPGAVDDPLEPGPCRRIVRVRDAEDDHERAVAPVAEVVLQHRADVLRVGTGNREDVRLERREPARRPEADDDHRQPRGHDRPTEPHRRSRPLRSQVSLR
jgi:hypothetical protein